MRGLALLVALAITASACGSTAAAPNPSPTRLPTASVARATPTPAPTGCVVKPVTFVKAPSKAVITLEKGGTITIALRPDKAPNTVTNFANVALSGCYDGLTFHRVELGPPPFVIQGGDPLGNGTGGGTQPAEYNDLSFVKGAVGIARGQDKTINNKFQFYICIGECKSLDGQYTNFGLVTDGQSVADGVRKGDKIKTITVE